MKRFSEADRKVVVELVATKLQLAHDECRRETDKIQTALDQVREETRLMEERGVGVACLLGEFASRHDEQLVAHVTNKRAVRQLVDRMKKDLPTIRDHQALLRGLQQTLVEFFKQVSH